MSKKDIEKNLYQKYKKRITKVIKNKYKKIIDLELKDKSFYLKKDQGFKDINNAKKVVKEKQEKADASAAALILQRYLDRKNNKEN